jgi:hypothetical protein
LHAQQQQAAADMRDMKGTHKQRQQQQQHGLQAALHRALGIGEPANTPRSTMR